METLGDRPFCRCMDGLSLTWRNDGAKKGVALLELMAVIASSALERLLRRCTIEAYQAIRSNSGYNSAPYWGTSYYCCWRVLG